MTTPRWMRWLGGAVLVAGLSTCGDPVEPPTPGWVPVRLTTPNTNDGALLFTVSGAGADSIRSRVADRYFRRDGTANWRGLVRGAITNGSTVAEIWVPDTRTVTGYTGTIEQAARAGTYEQQDLTGYALSIQSQSSP